MTGQRPGEYSPLLPSVVVSSGLRHAQISRPPDEVGFGSAGGVLFAAPYRAAEQSIETLAHHVRRSSPTMCRAPLTGISSARGGRAAASRCECPIGGVTLSRVPQMIDAGTFASTSSAGEAS